ncbi:GNAT family N-acetyltransferase [Sneathiella sp. P13V-1]|uniref:GNAT family N-acetyltransferase n=1 Tax=Sneathiella sp. P13V-1 TaxID=2697366 RepID=UPI00187B867D|nr:GNAT family N-acetyltransferase [Sneathiella sp. P13V-1]
MSDKNAEISFRKAKVEDLEDVVEMLADDQLGSVREQASRPLPLIYREAFERMSRQNGNDLFVTVKNGQVIGCMQLTIIHGISRKGMSRCQIEGVRISSKARGGGIGGKMMKFAIEYAKKQGCGLVQLTTDLRRKDAHKFYEDLGFSGSHLGMKLDLLNQ